MGLLALIAQWAPLVTSAISNGSATVNSLREAFGVAHPQLSAEQRAEAWQAIIDHDTVRAAIAHAAAGD